MRSIATASSMERYTLARQARGAFDGGRITESKPIGFPGEGDIERIGPLFYWAWATSHAQSVIGMHPHRGFEIVSYVLAGEMTHRDTLGTVSQVGKGGVQAMRTGSGVSHQEEVSDGGEFFQIWFEPDLKKAMEEPATYQEIHASDLPVVPSTGVTETTVLGEGSPVDLSVSAEMKDVTIEGTQGYTGTLAPGRVFALVVVEGEGTIVAGDTVSSTEAVRKDFIVVKAGDAKTEVEIKAASAGFRFVVIEVPETVDYPLYTR